MRLGKSRAVHYVVRAQLLFAVVTDQDVGLHFTVTHGAAGDATEAHEQRGAIQARVQHEGARLFVAFQAAAGALQPRVQGLLVVDPEVHHRGHRVVRSGGHAAPTYVRLLGRRARTLVPPGFAAVIVVVLDMHRPHCTGFASDNGIVVAKVEALLPAAVREHDEDVRARLVRAVRVAAALPKLHLHFERWVQDIVIILVEVHTNRHVDGRGGVAGAEAFCHDLKLFPALDVDRQVGVHVAIGDLVKNARFEEELIVAPLWLLLVDRERCDHAVVLRIHQGSHVGLVTSYGGYRQVSPLAVFRNRRDAV